MYTCTCNIILNHPFGTCTIDETKSLHLKITPSLPDPPTVQDHHVPIFTCSQEDVESAPWDLTIEQVNRSYFVYHYVGSRIRLVLTD